MTRGMNLADPLKRVIYKSLYESEIPCVFISHKREDTSQCEQIANYLMNAGLNVYFDKYDATLQHIAREGDPDKLTQRIKDGIINSTHMLCVVSPRTKGSFWVPFEVGYGYEQIPLGILTLIGLKENELPDYMRVKGVELTRGINSLNRLIARLLNRSISTMIATYELKESNDAYNPLRNILEP